MNSKLRGHLAVLGVVITCCAVEASAEDGAELRSEFLNVVAPFVKSYCLDCHGAEVQEAKLDLSEYSSAESIAKAHQIWAIVLERIEAGEMPPKDADPQPTAEQRRGIVEWIRSAR